MSTSLTIARSPSCNQLRFAAFNRRKSPSVFLRMIRVQKPCPRQIRCFSGSRDNGNGNVTELRTNSDFTADAFSGWSGNGSQESSESQPKKGLSGGMVGAGVAGIILIAGLTFAALSMNKRVSGPKQKMEPLTTHQEESPASADQNDTVEEEQSKGENAVPYSISVESGTGTDKDSSSYANDKETTTENELGHGTNLEYASRGGEVMNNVSVQQDLQGEIPKDEVPVDPVETSKLPELGVHDGSVDASSIGNSNGTLFSEKLESSNELKDDSADTEIVASLVSDVVPTFPNTDYQEVEPASKGSDKSNSPLEVSVGSQLDAVVDPQLAQKEDIETISRNEDFDFRKKQEFSGEENKSYLESHNLGAGLSIPNPESALPYPLANEQKDNDYIDNIRNTSIFDLMDLEKLSSSASIPAPSVVSPALQALPGKVLVPAVVDQVQGQALAALQALKVIESDVQPGDLCTRREYARWLVSASSALSRNTMSKVYPAMFIENVTELAFDDITPEDPDFSSIQGLAEAGLIASKLSRRDMNSSDQDESSLCFSPECPLSRQDLVSWKMSLEKRLLPAADRLILQQLSGFIDIDKINPDAWPALIADLSAGEQGIVGLAFGYTRLFQPDKPVTKAQAAIALATGEASDIVSEELARIEAESMAEKAVAAHSALVDQVEKDVNANFEKDILLEREKINAVEKMAEEAKRELERLRAEREEENIKLMKGRATVDSEMEVLSRLRHEVEEQLQGIMSNKVEISYEKERLNKLRTEAEIENKEIARLQYELEVERKALSMARAWAEDEAKRAREQARVLDEARERWENQGIKVVVDNDLREEANAGVTWLSAGKQFSIEGTKSRAENLVDKLKTMAADVSGKFKETIDMIIQKILLLTSQLKEWASKAGGQVGGIKDGAVSRVSSSIQDLQQSSVGLSSNIKERAKQVVGDCRVGVEKLTQKFKT